MSYNGCFRRNLREWRKIGLYDVKQRPITMISCGYAEQYRREIIKEYGKETWDVKPEFRDIVRWI